MLAAVGGKAANLGELTRAGFAVPQGFCVTTEAYREVVERAGLDRLLAVSWSRRRRRSTTWPPRPGS